MPTEIRGDERALVGGGGEPRPPHLVPLPPTSLSTKLAPTSTMGLSSLVSKASSAVGGGAGAAQSPSKTSGNGAAAPSNEDKIPEGAAADDVEQLDDEPRNSASSSLALSSCSRRGSGLPCPPDEAGDAASPSRQRFLGGWGGSQGSRWTWTWTVARCASPRWALRATRRGSEGADSIDGPSMRISRSLQQGALERSAGCAQGVPEAAPSAAGPAVRVAAVLTPSLTSACSAPRAHQPAPPRHGPRQDHLPCVRPFLPQPLDQGGSARWKSQS